MFVIGRCLRGSCVEIRCIDRRCGYGNHRGKHGSQFCAHQQRLDRRLKTKHQFDTFVHYFLFRLVLINLSVDTQHVPMVFEVINDRGVRLKPYEILKGKLLGQIDKWSWTKVITTICGSDSFCSSTAIATMKSTISFATG